jgi:methionine-rich copper-binding protein CopC
MKQVKWIAAALACGLTIAVSPPARAHAFPIRSEPRVGSTLSTPPSKVIIWFDGEIEPAFSALAVYNSTGQRTDKDNSRVDPADASVLEVDLPPLAPGVYRVRWKVLAKDTHVTEGEFSFTIAGGGK